MSHQSANHDDIVAIPLRHPWRWVSAALLALILGLFIYSLVSSPNINHDIVNKYLFNQKVIEAALLTVVLTVVSMAIGTILAIILAVMKLSSNPVLRVIAGGYIGFFRGTPLLLQVVFWGYLGIIYPTIDVGIPFTDIIWWSEKTSLVFTSLVAGIIALSLNEAAYAAEIVRAGILSVDQGQAEAAKSLGMSSGYTLRRVVLPQAMRVIIPPLTSQYLNLIKNSSLAVAVGYPDLVSIGSTALNQTGRAIECIAVVMLCYLSLSLLTSALMNLYNRRVQIKDR